MPIAWLLPLVLAGLVLVAIVPVVLLGYYGARDNTGRLLRDRSELVLDSVVDRIAATSALCGRSLRMRPRRFAEARLTRRTRRP
jgi:hypothetical protein